MSECERAPGGGVNRVGVVLTDFSVKNNRASTKSSRPGTRTHATPATTRSIDKLESTSCGATARAHACSRRLRHRPHPVRGREFASMAAGIDLSQGMLQKRPRELAVAKRHHRPALRDDSFDVFYSFRCSRTSTHLDRAR